MPFVRIMLAQPADVDPRAVGDCVHRALVETLGIPEEDRFQVISRHTADEVVFDPSFPGVERGDGIVFIQITLTTRTTAQKRALYRGIADRLAAGCGIRPADVFVTLLEIPPENFSFGDGRAQYADQPPPHLVRRAVTTDRVPAPVGPFSLGIPGGGLLYLSGQVAQDPATGTLIDGDAARQADQILRNVTAILAAAGKDLSDVVRVGVYLADMADFAPVNQVYAKYFTEPYPARTTIGVAALPLGAAVEMDLVVS